MPCLPDDVSLRFLKRIPVAQRYLSSWYLSNDVISPEVPRLPQRIIVVFLNVATPHFLHAELSLSVFDFWLYSDPYRRKYSSWSTPTFTEYDRVLFMLPYCFVRIYRFELN